jgi:hypothetical protein
MGKQIRLREAQKRASEQALYQILRQRVKVRPPFIDSFAEFAPNYRAKVEQYRRFAIRLPEDWKSSVRSRSPERRFIDLARFVFARYPVARHLESVWDQEPRADVDTEDLEAAPSARGRVDRYYWYILAAQGKSLYREGLRYYLSKHEAHHFLGAPPEVVSTERAFWYAIAMAANADVEVAVRVSRTKLVDFPIAWKFWKDVARFFACNPLSVLEMNDFIDYFQATKDLDDSFEVHGSALSTLRGRVEEWKHILWIERRLDGDNWSGRPIPDAVYRTEEEGSPAVWRIHQITDAIELSREGERLRHCVAKYRSSCMASKSSIWSLTYEYPFGKFNRGLTIEVDDEGAIAQCRGFANRAPLERERAILQRWASDVGLSFVSSRY